jgi:hypothetical protein
MTKQAFLSPLLLALSLALAGCAEDIGFDDQGDDGSDDQGDEGNEPADEAFVHEELGGGVVRTTADASDEAKMVYLDLDGQAAVAEGEDGWDLGFRRYEVILAGGISGDAGVEVAIVEGTAFEQLTAVPEDAQWRTDAADGEDEDTDPDLAFIDWYDYDFMTHLLSPKDRVYLVRSSDGAVFKLQIADYYSETGTAGFVQFYWAPLG